VHVTYSSDTPGETYQVDEEYHVGLDDNVEVYQTLTDALDYYVAWGVDLNITLVQSHYDCFGDLIAITKEVLEVEDL